MSQACLLARRATTASLFGLNAATLAGLSDVGAPVNVRSAIESLHANP
jgi:hypothetical protein